MPNTMSSATAKMGASERHRTLMQSMDAYLDPNGNIYSHGDSIEGTETMAGQQM
jgi:hypothetical protein